MYFNCTVVGWLPSDFMAADGKEVKGYKVWALRSLLGDSGEGSVAVETYITSDRLGGRPPVCGDDILLERRFYKGKTKYCYVGPAGAVPAVKVY